MTHKIGKPYTVSLPKSDETRNADTARSLLASRGILDTARAASWKITIHKSIAYFRYPVTGPDGATLAYRLKALESDQKPKYLWPDGKPDGCDTYIMPGVDLLTAIRIADGVLHVVNGEPAVLAMVAAGVKNAASFGFGETHVPRDIADTLARWDVQTVRYYADNDDTGRKAAAKWRDRLAGTGIDFQALDLAGHVDDGGDVNDLWIARGFDCDRFTATLDALPALVLPEPTRTDNQLSVPKTEPIDGDVLATMTERIGAALDVTGWATDSDGYTRKAIPCPVSHHDHDDRRPAAYWNASRGHLHCFKCGENYNLKQLADALDVDWPQSQQRKRKPGVDLDALPDTVTLDTITADAIVNVPYVSDVLDRFNRHDLLLVKSAIGTGKTTAGKQFIQQWEAEHGRAPRVTAFSHRQSLSLDVARSYEIDCYLDYKRDARDYMPSVPQLAICVNSAHQRTGDNGDIVGDDIVFVDEVSKLRTHFTGDTFRKGEAIRAYGAFAAILRAAGQVIVLDAHMTDVDREWLENLTGKRAYVIENTYRRAWADLTVHRYKDTVIAAALDKAATASAPVLVPCDSRTEARAIYQLAGQRGIPADDMILIDAWNSESESVRAILRDADNALQRFRLVIYTPSVDAGVDLQGPVAGVYGVFQNGDMTPAEWLQMLGRARNADEYHAYVRPATRDLETDWRGVFQRHHLNATQTARKARFAAYDLPAIGTDQRELLTLAAKDTAARNRQRENPLAYFTALAREQGHAISTRKGRDKVTAKALAEARETVREYDQQQTIAAAPVSPEELDALRAGGAVSEEHRYGFERWKIENTAGLIIDEQLYSDLHTHRQRAALRLFTDLETDLDDLRARDRGQALDGMPVMKRGNYTEKRELLDMLLWSLFDDDLLDSREEMTRSEILERTGTLFDDHTEAIKRVFGWRNDYSADRLQLVRLMLKRVGLRLDYRRVMRDGVRFYLYWLDGDAVTKMRRYATSRRAYLADGLPKTRETDHTTRDLGNGGAIAQGNGPPEGDVLALDGLKTPELAGLAGS